MIHTSLGKKLAKLVKIISIKLKKVNENRWILLKFQIIWKHIWLLF